jgi:hypothetical protein
MYSDNRKHFLEYSASYERLKVMKELYYTPLVKLQISADTYKLSTEARKSHEIDYGSDNLPYLQKYNCKLSHHLIYYNGREMICRNFKSFVSAPYTIGNKWIIKSMDHIIELTGYHCIDGEEVERKHYVNLTKEKILSEVVYNISEYCQRYTVCERKSNLLKYSIGPAGFKPFKESKCKTGLIKIVTSK